MSLQQYAKSLEPTFGPRPEGFVLIDADGAIVYHNPAYQQIFKHLSRNKLSAGKMHLPLLPKKLQNLWEPHLTNAQNGSPATFDVSVKTKRGICYFEICIAPVFLQQKFQGVTELIRDITLSRNKEVELLDDCTKLERLIIEEEASHLEANVVLAKEISERKLAEENLKESREWLYQILQGSSIPTFVVDQSHTVTHWNKALESLTGLMGDDMVGTKNQWKSFYLTQRPTMADLVVDRAMEERIRNYYGTKYRKSSLLEGAYEAEDFFDLDGDGKWLFFTAAPLKNTTGEIIGAIETLQDITARKRMEKEIRDAHDILEKRVTERTIQLKETYEQLLHAEKLSAVGKLAASIAHEFGNPIIGIRNFLKALLASSSLNKDDKEVLQLAIQECQRVRELISNLQDFNRPTTGNYTLMDVHSAIDAMLIFCKKNLKEKHIKVVKNYAPDLPAIFAVADQIKQVILNCLNNAAESISQAKGTIKINTEKRGEHVLLHISDTGKGIKEQDIDHIFEPFFSTKPAVEGTGLGLSVSYGIMKKHRGNIEVTKTSKRGTTFTLSFPLGEKAKMYMQP